MRLGRAAAGVTLLVLLSGCSLLFGGRESAPTATPEAPRLSVPTFTPTPIDQPSPTLAVATPVVLEVAPAATPATPPTPEAVVEAQATALPAAETIPTATAVAAASVTITAAGANLRRGPGTEFELAGSATQGESFAVVAKTAAGDWWQICCINGEAAWVFGELVTVQSGADVAVAQDLPTPPPTPEAVAEAPAAQVPVAEAPAAEAPPAEAPPAAAPDPGASSAGFFDPNAQYQIVHFKVLGLAENNGGIRDSRAQHHIFLTVLDQGGNGINGAVVQNLVGEKGQVVTGDKGPGKAEITMAWEPFKLQVASDPSGPVTSQISNQMGLAFPHLPDIVGKLGDESYEYGVCPTLEIKCQWPIQLVHFSYEITFQKVK